MSRKKRAAPKSAKPDRAAEERRRELAYLRQVEVALTRESKRRAMAERAVRKQSQALSNTLGLLLRKPEFPDFFVAILRAITRECGALWASYWEASEDGTFSRVISSHRDREVEGAVGRFVVANLKDMERLGRLYHELLETHRCSIILEAEDRRVPRTIRRFYGELGVRTVVFAPLLAGNRLIGFINYLSPDASKPVDPDKVAFLEGTTKQAALAVHLRTLSDEAREADRARESERAARRREEEISRISKLLLPSAVDTLEGEEGEIEALLGGILKNMVRVVGGAAASLWKWDESRQSASPIWGWDRGAARRLTPDAAEHLEGLSQRRHAKLVKSWVVADDLMDEPVRSKPVRWFLEQILPSGVVAGNRLLVAPLKVGNESQGFVLIVVAGEKWKMDERRLTLKALALQAGLVFRLDELSMAERSVALAAERSRIARDLHDLIAQSFGGIALQIEAIRAQFPDLPAPASERLQRIREQAVRGVDEVRRSIQMLRPALLDDRTLADALRSLASETEALHGIPVRMTIGPKFPALGSKVEFHLFAIASEAVQNAARYSGASFIALSLRKSSDRVLLLIRDNGCGFDERRKTQAPGAGFGLRSMEDRARAMGGTVSIHSKPGAGTRVQASITLQLNNEEILPSG